VDKNPKEYKDKSEEKKTNLDGEEKTSRHDYSVNDNNSIANNSILISCNETDSSAEGHIIDKRVKINELLNKDEEAHSNGEVSSSVINTNGSVEEMFQGNKFSSDISYGKTNQSNSVDDVASANISPKENEIAESSSEETDDRAPVVLSQMEYHEVASNLINQRINTMDSFILKSNMEQNKENYMNKSNRLNPSLQNASRMETETEDRRSLILPKSNRNDAEAGSSQETMNIGLQKISRMEVELESQATAKQSDTVKASRMEVELDKQKDETSSNIPPLSKMEENAGHAEAAATSVFRKASRMETEVENNNYLESDATKATDRQEAKYMESLQKLSRMDDRRLYVDKEVLLTVHKVTL
jgi:hypothetical protein